MWNSLKRAITGLFTKRKEPNTQDRKQLEQSNYEVAEVIEVKKTETIEVDPPERKTLKPPSQVYAEKEVTIEKKLILTEPQEKQQPKEQQKGESEVDSKIQSDTSPSQAERNGNIEGKSSATASASKEGKEHAAQSNPHTQQIGDSIVQFSCTDNVNEIQRII